MKLDQLSDIIINSPDGINTKAQNDFFNLFPASSTEFSCFYAYQGNWKVDTIIHCGIGCDLSEKHIQLTLNNLSSISDSSYVTKLLNTSIGLHYQPDGVNFFKHALKERLTKKPVSYDYLFANLSSKTREAIIDFWHFYYGGEEPFEPDQKIYSYCKEYTRVVRIHNKVTKRFAKQVSH